MRRERERLKEDAEQLEEMAEELRQKSSWVAQQHTEASTMLAEAQQGRQAIEDLGVAVASERDELLHLEAALTVSNGRKVVVISSLSGACRIFRTFQWEYRAYQEREESLADQRLELAATRANFTSNYGGVTGRDLDNESTLHANRMQTLAR